MQPRKTKYQKMHLGSLTGSAFKNNNLYYGKIGLISLESQWISSKQIEASLRTINRIIKKYGKCFTRVFPDKSRTVRPTESRMGSGKGQVSYWSARVKPNTILFEISAQVPSEICIKAFVQAARKLSVKTRIIQN